MGAYSKHWLLAAMALLIPWTGQAAQLPSSEVHKFVTQMVEQHGFECEPLQSLLAQIEIQEKILQAIASPAEAKPWHEYQTIFLTPDRINDGVEFWNQHREALEQVKQGYGVPAKIIVAILGVESRYGQHTGSYRVVDALATLAFAYPPRSQFFRRELEQFLLLAREEELNPLGVRGSYAGAMGLPQFISSSYRHYAVDSDGDGKRDLWNNPADIFASIANYFIRHGWEPDEEIAAHAELVRPRSLTLVSDNPKPKTTAGTLRKAGIRIAADWPENRRVALIELETASGPEYWAALNNFYVITRYNHSNLYAMAVFQLAETIAERQQQVH